MGFKRLGRMPDPFADKRCGFRIKKENDPDRVTTGHNSPGIGKVGIGVEVHGNDIRVC